MMDAAGDGGFKKRLSKLRHDMRTPVGHMIGYAEMLEEDLDEESAKMHSGDLQAIQNAGHRLLALIDDHLNAARESAEGINISDAQFQMRMQLNHIAGYTEMLREEALEEGHDELVGDLNHIADASKNMLELVEGIGLCLVETDSTAEPVTTDEPSTPAPAPEDSDSHLGTLIGQGGEILVVDDDSANRELLARRLTRSGYSSAVVESGEAALDLLEERRFDLILLDLMMPGLSGLETLERLKASPRLRTIPVIMLSAADDVDTMVDCILQGAEDYIFKPFNPILLQARISACLEKVRLRQNISRQFRVFISSPGDVIPERRIVKAVIGRLNEEFAGRAYLIPILWEEEPMLASETFQAQIHPPRETEIYIGILWSRIGSPLPDTILRPDGTRYDSGTAFEFEDAMHGFKATGEPEMMLYRKEGAPTVSLENKGMVMDRLDQIDKLQNYIDRWLIGDDGSYIGAFHMFGAEEQFDTMIEMHLRKLIEKKLMGDVKTE
jgi:DNA-binding response OmpR family regulator